MNCQKAEGLKPCPFCGSHKQVTSPLVDINGTAGVCVICSDCGAHGPTHEFYGSRKGIKYMERLTCEKACEVWNRRASNE